MPNMSIGQIVQVRVEWTLYGQRDLTVWNYRVTDVTGAIDMFDYLKNGVNVFFNNPVGGLKNLLSNLSEDITLDAIVSQVIFPTRYRAIRTGVNEIGGDASAAGTNNVALSVGVSGDLAGRGRGGRTQVPGIPKKYQIGAKWDAAIIAAAGDSVEAVRVGTITPAGFAVQLRSIIWSAKTGTYQNITGLETHTTVRTMRRRTYGVGQ